MTTLFWTCYRTWPPPRASRRHCPAPCCRHTASRGRSSLTAWWLPSVPPLGSGTGMSEGHRLAGVIGLLLHHGGRAARAGRPLGLVWMTSPRKSAPMMQKRRWNLCKSWSHSPSGSLVTLLGGPTCKRATGCHRLRGPRHGTGHGTHASGDGGSPVRGHGGPLPPGCLALPWAYGGGSTSLPQLLGRYPVCLCCQPVDGAVLGPP
jgi:hypothetical protein